MQEPKTTTQRFSTISDPDLGPDPRVFGLAQILMLVLVLATACSAYSLIENSAMFAAGQSIAIPIVGIVIAWLSPQFRKRAACFFVAGAIVGAVSVFLLIESLLSDGDLGMLAGVEIISSVLSSATLALGVWMQFVSLKWIGATVGTATGLGNTSAT